MMIRIPRRTFATKQSFDLLVIGGGPGGYVAAIKAAQMGVKTACVESRGALGGTCLNVGCIPSKALLTTTHLYHQAKHDFTNRGINGAENVTMDVAKMMQGKTTTVNGLTKGIEHLFKQNKVTYIKGHAKFTSPTEIAVGEDTYSAKDFIIATGSTSSPFGQIQVDETNIVSSTGALDFTEVPEKLIVIGGGVIGLELGSVWARLGSDVTVVEYMNAIGAGMDGEVAKKFQKTLAKQGLKFKLTTKVVDAKVNGDGLVDVIMEPSAGGKQETMTVNKVLLSIGRRPYTDNLGLEAAGIQLDTKGRIPVNGKFQSSVSHIRAIGDVIAGPMLAHKAEEEGVAAVENIKGLEGHVHYGAIPSVVYTHPEVAWVGITEEEAKKNKVEIKVGNFPMAANSRARANGDVDGFVKIITEKSSGKILGAHIVGANAGEMIAEAVIGIQYGASAEDLARTCHAHPTLSEAFKEACMAANDKPIHM